jgi:hypothetical protein
MLRDSHDRRADQNSKVSNALQRRDGALSPRLWSPSAIPGSASFGRITKRLSDMTDAELAALEQRMIAAAPIMLDATADVVDDAGELPDGDTDAEQDGDGCADDEARDT